MKLYEKIINVVFTLLWIVSGVYVIHPLDGATFQTAWIMGAFFALFAIQSATNILIVLFHIFPKLEKFVTEYYGTSKEEIDTCQ